MEQLQGAVQGTAACVGCHESSLAIRSNRAPLSPAAGWQQCMSQQPVSPQVILAYSGCPQSYMLRHTGPHNNPHRRKAAAWEQVRQRPS